MPGRQAHGRSLISDPKSRKGPKPRAKAKAKGVALDAFAIAAGAVSTSQKGVRTRDLDPEPEQKRRRTDVEDDDNEDEDDEEGENLGNSRAKRQRRDGGDDGSNDEFASDSEGVEWRVGLGEDDDDSEIDSDEAFGESDEEKFEGFTFAGSSSNKRTKQNGRSVAGLDDMESDEDDDDGSLGEDAIDLAQALDDFSEDDESASGSGSGSRDSDSGTNSPDTDDEEDKEEDVDDPTKFDALKSLVSTFAGEEPSGKEGSGTSRSKIDLQDLGLFGVKDQNIKKSLKLMKKEEKANKPGTSKKLDVPLARRHQERLLRVAASEKANKTLDRWLETVTHNRRADHLVFPLPESLPNAGLDNKELMPLTQKTAGTELEQTIMSIIAESGLAPAAKKNSDGAPAAATEEEDPSISRAELQSLWNERRREREAVSREQARAKRIKKIKSKSYRRVHRKELAKIGLQEAEEGGDMDSEEEREAQHRRRATERMGARHRESKWAKSAKKTGRAAWDDDFRAGLTDMARRDEELRRRVEGKTPGSEDDDDGSEASDSDDETGKQRLLRELEQVAAVDNAEPVSGLMKLPFMRRAEAAQKKKNDETIADIMRQMASNSENESEDERDGAEMGRRTFGGADPKASEEEQDAGPPKVKDNASRAKLQARPAVSLTEPPKEAWSQPQNAKERRRAKRQSKAVESIDVMEAALEIAAPKPKKPAKLSSKIPGPNRHLTTDAPDTSSDEDEGEADRRPLRIRDAKQAEKAFGGDDVELEFAQEKAQMEEQQDDQVIDETLPGWGSWAGEGVSKRAAKRQEKLFQKVVKGVKKTDRKDAKLDRVVISEKRVKKNDKYMASQLPHEFENQYQYERTLRLPLGKEWSTKETFQDTTKPRIILKQGIITPMSKPRM